MRATHFAKDLQDAEGEFETPKKEILGKVRKK